MHVGPITVKENHPVGAIVLPGLEFAGINEAWFRCLYTREPLEGAFEKPSSMILSFLIIQVWMGDLEVTFLFPIPGT